MKFYLKKIIIFIILILLLPTSLFPQAERDELFTEVEILLDEAKLYNADVLCKDTYIKGVDEYLSAKELHRTGSSAAKIREKLESSITYITKVNNNIEEKQKLFASTIKLRNMALESGADKNAKYFWNFGEKYFHEILDNYDDGDTLSIPRKKKTAEEYYTNATLYSNKANSLINSESLIEANNNNANLIAPISYQKAEEKLFETLEMISNGKGKNEITKSIIDTELLYDMASVKASKYMLEYPEIIFVRKNAKIVEADKYTKELWNEAEENLIESAENFEEGDFENASELEKKANSLYIEAKQISLKDYFLSDAKREIELALDEGAEEFAPKTIGKSQNYFSEVSSIIEDDSYSLSQIKDLTKKSYESAQLARKITEIAKRMEPNDEPWEDIILAKEGDLLNNNEEASENISKENNNNFDQFINSIETNINDEVEITEDDEKVILLLKNVQFRTMSSRLNKNAKNSLDKIINQLKKETFDEATIVCYTDNIGTKSANSALSKKRAEAILDYIITKDNSHKYYIEGRGEKNPIASNSTAEGRKKNRRVEIEIR
jgi:outer membrane protein OmpA-like peptidoglycan-associated protein